MDRKSRKELLVIIEEQNKNLTKYKSRLHDIVESYKHLVKEKEALENSIKTLTDVGSLITSNEDNNTNENSEDDKSFSGKRNEDCLAMLRASLGALTVEKSRIENELRADRKKLLQQKEELERRLVENENRWFLEEENSKNQIQELKKKVSAQQKEREKEQQDHALMLKELQNLLASERAAKEKVEEQLNELQQRFSANLSEKRALEYEKCIEELQSKLKISQDKLLHSESLSKKHSVVLEKLQEEMDEMKFQYLTNIDEEKKRADMAEEKLKLLTIVKEKRIASLENKISELSVMVGNYDKLRQQDQHTIHKLKEKIAQLQTEYSAIAKVSSGESKLWEYGEPDISSVVIQSKLENASDLTDTNSKNICHCDCEKEINLVESLHSACEAEIIQLKEELQQYKTKAEFALKEKYNKTSNALLSDAKAEKEIKELKSKLTQLQDQLQTSKSQLKVNEEYHNTITTNLEKSIEELKIQHKQYLTQIEVAHRTKLLELEHQIQKQRERTLSLLEEKDKEIGLLKSSFLSSFTKKENPAENILENVETSTSDQEAAAMLLSNSLISSKKDGHILHYIQELARKDVEISNLRHSRIQTESALRKLQQMSAMMEDKYSHEIETLKSKIKLLEGEDRDGTNGEYLKNVILRFLKCNDPNSRQHMVNAIATVLHFTSNEVQEAKANIKSVR